MGKKKPEEMEKLRVQFLEGASRNKIPEKKADKLYELIQKFAGYGFNKSHAAAYAVVCYQTAYLKAHYPTEFMAALMTSDMGNADKIVGYFTECRGLGIPVLPPDVNQSQKHFAVHDAAIRFGLAAIKNVGEGAVESVIAIRNESGPFQSLFDFCRRVDLHKTNKRMMEGFIKAGAFDSTGGRRSQLMAVLDQAMEEGAAIQKERALGQTSMFACDPGIETHATALADPPLPNVPEWSQGDRLKYERELTGFYISAHPLARYEAAIRLFTTATTETLADLPDGREVKLCGIITAVKSMLTRKGDRMAYLTVEDLHGMVEVIAFPDLYKDSADLIVPEQVVRFSGTVDRGDKGIKIRGSKIEVLAELQTRAISKVAIRLSDAQGMATKLSLLQQVLQRHPGASAVTLIFAMDPSWEARMAPNVKVAPSEHFVADIEEVLGKGSVTLLS
jgi:DNA polymerase-3 subunit alpha